MGVAGCIARGLVEDYLTTKAIEVGAALLGPLLGAAELPPPPSPPQPAVTSTKQIKHTSFLAALAGAVAGAIVAAAITAAAVALVGATGGAALVVGVGACFLLGSVISGVSSGVTGFVDGLFPAADGPVLLTSPTVFIGGLPAARAGIDLVACVKHSVPPLIAEGSDSITIEGFPAARINDKVACGAALKQGITTVMLGGEKVQMVKIDDEFAWWQKGILIAVDYLIPPSNCLKQGLRNLPGALLKGGKNIGNLLKSGSKTVASFTKSAGKYLATRGKAAWNAALAGIRKGAQVAANAMKSLRAQLGKLKGALKSVWAGTCGKCKPKKRKASGDKPGTNKPDAKACKNDPIDTSTGAVVDKRVDLEFGQTLVFRLVRSYDSQREQGGSFGRGWRDSLDEHLRLSFGGDLVELCCADGDVVPFDIASDAERVFNPRFPHYTLERTATGFSVHDLRDDRTRHFEVHADRARLVRLADAHDNRVDFEYAADGHLAVLRHSDGPVLQLRHHVHADGRCTLRIERTDLPAPLVLARYTTERGLLIEAESTREYHFLYTYDDHGRLSRWADATHTWNTYAYDADGRCIATRGAGGLYVGTFEYDRAQRRTVARDGRGRVSEYRFDADGRLVERTDPLGSVDRWNYDRHGRLTGHTDPGGATERFEYDPVSGILTRRIDREEHVTEFFYDDELRVTAVVDSLEQAWRYERDEQGAVTQIVAPDETRHRYQYNARGQLVGVTRPDGATHTRTHDDRHHLVEESDWSGQVHRYIYDARDRLVESRDPLGHAESFFYDPRDRLVALRHPDGHQARYEFDAEHNLVAVTDENGHTTRAEYGAFDLQTAVSDPEGRRYEFAHDPDHILLSEVRAPDGRRYRLERDAAGRVVQEIDYHGSAIRYAHDPAGRVTARVNAVDQHTAYRYDRNGELTAIEADGETTTFERDALGRLIRAENHTCKLEWQYDALGRLVRSVQDGEVLEYAHDDAGRCVQRTLHPGPWQAVPHTTGYVHDLEGRLVRLALATDILDIVRDPRGQPEELRSPSGFRLTQRHDARGVLLEQRVQAPHGGALVAREYSYDPALNPVAIRDGHGGLTEYRYDRSDRVLETRRPSPAGESFCYTATGQLAAAVHTGRDTNFEYAASGRLGRTGDTEHIHDDAGRLIARAVHRKGFCPARWRFTWDSQDQLVEVQTPDDGTWRYSYDPLGRRIRKYNPSTRESVHFLWDGDVLLREVHAMPRGPVQDQQAVRITHWHHEPGTFRPLAKEEGGQTYFVATDHLGTPKELLSPNGTVTWRAQHATWGALRPECPDAGQFCPIRFQGQYEDSETGLHYNRFRYYDPAIAAYLSPDPLGLLGGLQPHAYVHNPTTWLDPLGLAGCGPTTIKHHSQKAARRAAERDAGMGKHGARESLPDQPLNPGSRAPQGPPGVRTESRSPETGRVVHHDPYGNNYPDAPEHTVGPHYGVEGPGIDGTIHHTYPSTHDPTTNR